MTKSFKKALFGYKPDAVQNEIGRLDSVHQQETTALRAEIEKTRASLDKTETEAKALQPKLEEFASREQSIVDVMVLAQKKALQLEEEAHRQAKGMLDTAERELKDKQQEMERLNEKLARFKQEFKGLLDEYRFSIESMSITGDQAPGLKLLENEKSTEIIKDILLKKDSS